MKLLRRKLLLLILISGFTLGSYAQSLDQAKKLYNEGQFEEAKPAFEKLVNQSPSNSSYNLWYGVCCFETGDLNTAEKHLLVANKRKVVDSYRYLAHIYTSTYRFGEAVTMWEDYIGLMAKRNEDTEAYEIQLEQAEKMLRMQEKTEDIQVIDSMVVSKDQLLSTYFLSKDCGVLQMFNDFFQSSVHSLSTVYISPKGDQAYYGRPSQNGLYTLYTQSKLLDTWTDEKPLFTSDSAENNYPFVLGDGVTLYFASKGNGSIGGYDLFVTRYNTNTNSYLASEQMGMPFNSPANDYLMVVDEAKGLGWFVSDRNQPEGKICVYLFIPDGARKRIAESEEDEWIRKRAALSSIKDTWQADSNYSEQIRLAKTDFSLTQKTVKKDFEFIVNDQVTYYTWSEFRSAEARTFYEKMTGLTQKLNALENKLNDTRLSYTKGSKSVQEQLKPTILHAEEELKILLIQIDEWEKKARNAENVFLKN